MRSDFPKRCSSCGARGAKAVAAAGASAAFSRPCINLALADCNHDINDLKMFFVIERWESVALRPAQLGPEYLSCVEALLRQQVEGKCLQSVGYVVCVIRVLQNMPGRIQDSTGFVVVAAKYQAIVFKPFKEEVLDAVITDVNKLGLFAQCGPLKVFVSRASLPPTYTFQEEEAVPSFSDGSVALRIGGEIRLKLLGVRFDASQIFAVATINADYLGPIEPRDAATA